MSQKTELLIATAARTSNSTYSETINCLFLADYYTHIHNACRANYEDFIGCFQHTFRIGSIKGVSNNRANIFYFFIR
jgi:hypothetical protein